MLNLGISELMIVGVLALVFVGPDSLPQLARGAGKLYGKLRNVKLLKKLLDRFCTHARVESVIAVLIQRVIILVFRQNIANVQRRIPIVRDDVSDTVKYTLNITEGDIEEISNSRGKAL